MLPNTRTLFPFKISNIDSKVEEEIEKSIEIFFLFSIRKHVLFLDTQRKFVKVGPNEWCVTKHYEEYAETIYNFPLENNDVIVAGIPRSGTNLTQELVWLLGNDLNFECAKEVSLLKRSPAIE